jgi:multicomponent Na+:H+ antiporter subunit E
MGNRIVYFILLFLVWLLLTWSVDVQNILAGAVVAAVTAAAFGHLFFERAGRVADPRRIFWFLYYIPVFVFHMVRANVDVAYRVLHLNMPIRPGIVRIKTTLTNELALTMLANSITLTPGTLTVDIIGDDLYIHWINIATGDPKEQTERIAQQFEQILKRIFE